ncbi:hypothetical protein PC128_g22937 [Phytophthora cactorum]|nr:hypothetical protein PC128_g22937 [Phytophthora cactorum]
MGIPHMSCIAHSLHLVVAGALIKRRRQPRREANTEVTSASLPESRNPLLSSASAVFPEVLELSTVFEAQNVSVEAPGETASVGVVNVACETAPADNGTYTEAEPWEQDRAVQELADFLREWQVMEQLYALDEVRDLVQRFRDLATFFHTSQKATNRQHNIQERLIAADRTGETELHARKRQPLKVLTDCPTRWDSARDLLARMVDLKQPLKGFHRYLKSTRGKKEFKPTPSLFQPSQKD